MERRVRERSVRYRTPCVEIYETPDSVILRVEMPGVEKEDFDIGIDNNELTIKGNRKAVDSNLRLIRQESDPATYLRTFALGEQIDASRIEAKLDRGILTLTLHKKEEVLPKKIGIES